jgi:methyltransferase (TIGR00027 family)
MSAASRLGALALTGWWTAAARAIETQRGDRLFEDPWAAILAGQQVVDEFARAIKDTQPETADLHAIITRFFDDFLLHAAGVCGIRQVILVASGLDSRAFRLDWPPKTRLFELDQPHVIAYKNAHCSLVGAIPRCVRHCIGIDLNESCTESLRRNGFNPTQRSVWRPIQPEPAQRVEILTQGPFEIGHGRRVAKSNLGKGILPPETFDPTRSQCAIETVE